jgi:hypothetical protein
MSKTTPTEPDKAAPVQPALTVNLAPEIVTAIEAGLAEIVAAEADRKARHELYDLKRAERDADEEALKKLGKADPEDEMAVTECTRREVRLKLWPRKLAELERNVFLADDRIENAKTKVRGDLGLAGQAITAGRRDFVYKLLRPLHDERFGQWVASQWPPVREGERFVGLCREGLEEAVGLSLAQIASVVLKGELPPLPPAPNPIWAAAVVHSSRQPASQ